MIEWLPWLPSKSCYTNLKFFETLKDTPNPSKGFRFVAFLVLEILGGSFSTPPPPLVLGVGTKTLGARRVKEGSVRNGVLQHIFIYLASTREAKIGGGGRGEYTFLERPLFTGSPKIPKYQSHMSYKRKAFVAEAYNLMCPISLSLKCYLSCIFGRNCLNFDLRQYQNHRIKS